MKQWRAIVLAAPAIALSANAAIAHHSFTAEYDARREASVQGVVTEFRFVNPHALMSVDVTDNTGKVVTWTIEFAGRLQLTGGGWTEHTIPVGQRVTVTGNPSHTGSPRMYFRKLVKADGTDLLSPTVERNNAIEQERRQRALRRNQQK